MIVYYFLIFIDIYATIIINNHKSNHNENNENDKIKKKYSKYINNTCIIIINVSNIGR